MIRLEPRLTGAIICFITIPHITVADDRALLSNSRNEMQYMLDDSGDSNQEGYIIHTKKSGELAYPKKHRKVKQKDFQQLSKPINLKNQLFIWVCIETFKIK